VFEIRADAMEFLDSADIDETLALQSYRFMAVVNKYFGGTAVMRDFILDEASRKKSAPLKILDIGSGSCDIPAAVCKWAKAKGFDIEFTCVEPSGYAAKAAKQNIMQYQNIKLVREDIFSYQPTEEYDCATGSLFFHHLTDEQITELIERLRTFGCRSILINDLHRSLSCYIGCLLASMFVPAGVRHDALLSIRKGFKTVELKELLGKIPQAHTSLRTAWFGRICAVIQFDAEDSK
jgi:hypothetical protein